MTATGAYPLTPAQQRMWIVHRLNPASTAYNSPVVRTLRGPMDPQRLQRALAQLVRRHDQLHVSFAVLGGEPVQTIIEGVSPEFHYLEDIAAEDVSRTITDFIRPFALDRAPLLRAALLHLPDGAEGVPSYVLVLDLHHIVCDLTSEEILVHDLLAIYHDLPLPEVKVSFVEHARRDVTHSTASLRQKDEDFWCSTLAGELPVLRLPTDHRRPGVFDFRGTIRHFPVGSERTASLRAFAASQGVSIQDVVLTAVFVLLAKYSFQDDLIVGVPREFRPEDDLAEVVGLFLNTLPIRADVHPDKAARTLLAEISDSTHDASRHFRCDVGHLVERLRPPRDPSRNPLYDVLFFHHRVRTQTYSTLDAVPRQFRHDKAEVDLTFGLLETDGRLDFSIEFATSIFDSSTIDRMAKHLLAVVDSIVASPEIAVGDVDILDAGERRLIASFNRTTRVCPEGTIDSLFDAQVARLPDHPAIRSRGETVSYRELDARANKVANLLRAHGITAGDVVALLTHSSVDAVAGMLGILKSGCAYLPIAPNLPTGRIADMLGSAGATLVLVEHLPAGELGADVVELRLAEDHCAEPQPARECDPAALSCVLYTSGSTGRPKGTLVRHFNVVHTVVGSNYLEILPTDRLLQLAGLGFDASLLEVFGGLLNGATVVVADEASRRDLGRIAHLLDEEHITVTFMTSALFNAMVDEKPAALSGLRAILTGGECASADHMRRALRYLRPGVLSHVYGPTEGTVFTTHYPVNEVADGATTVPIGYPLSNRRISIVNGRSPVPVGVVGELCIAGGGLVAGYLDQALTAERFVHIAGERCYRTGDIAKWRDDGAIEFIGRRDRQVKIRGFRIEPEEVEAVLRSHPGVREAVVVVDHDTRGDKRLRSLYTRTIGSALAPEALAAHARRILPDYMIPALISVVEAFPLDANGKVDRRNLPSNSDDSLRGPTDHLPVTHDEKAIAAIWMDLLNLGAVDIHRDFFDCGGHSLTATILSSRLEEALDVPVTLRDIFEHPTVAELATHLSGIRRSRRPAHRMPHAPRLSHYPLSFSERMVYAHQHAGTRNHGYHSIFPMLIAGVLDVERLESALRAVIRRHDAFRSGFQLRDGVPVKTVADHVDFHLTQAEGTEADVAAMAARLREEYDLAAPPLFRASLLRVGEQRHIFVLANHHIISDGVTEALLMREISRLYRGESLDPDVLRYTDYTLWEQGRWEEGGYRAQERYWLKQLRGPLPVLELPMDRPRPAEMNFAGHTITLRLDSAQTRRLRDEAAAHRTTLFTILFATYSTLLHEYSGHEDLVIGVPVANRTHPDVESTAGMFVNMVPWRTRPRADMAFGDYVEAIKAAAVAVFENQDYPFEQIVQQVQGHRDPSRNPLFDTMFVFHSTGPAILDIEGLHIEPYPVPETSAKVDLTLDALEYADEIRLSFTYATALFHEDTIARTAKSFCHLVSEIIAHPEKPLGQLRCVPQANDPCAIGVMGSSVETYAKDASLYQVFAQCVRRYAGRAALRSRDSELTYAQLHERAEAMAVRLQELGVIAGEPVALLTPRSVEMVVGIWAILRVGCTYVPIDPALPPSRIHAILSDSGSRVCLTTAMIRAATREGEVAGLPPLGPPAAPAYVMYTSGSTGKPKGIAVTHHGVLRTVMSPNDLTVTPEDSVLQLVNYAFDLSVFDIFGSLLNGATLVLPQHDDITDPERFAAVIDEYAVTMVMMTTALFNAYVDIDPAIFAPLRKVLFGGERASAAHVDKAFARLGAGKLVNVYGPTEATVCSTTYTIDGPAEDVPIGKPLPNTRLYVLDSRRRPTPLGVPGELYVGGDGVALGYWGAPALTSECFVPDPWTPGQIMYKTGDLVKRRADGNLLYLKRIDHQIKLRGFRIEPAEIEAHLNTHPGIGQCAVVVTGDRLVAHYTSTEAVDDAKLKTHLRASLPYYMVPDHLVRCAQLPLTPNGKIDRRALCTRPIAPSSRHAHPPPNKPVEKLLAALWCSVFGRDAVGLDENFYALGGHSLKALQIVSLLRTRGYALSVSDLFRHPTIRAVAPVVRHLDTASWAPQAVTSSDGFPLSAVQNRFFQRDLVDRNMFNSPFLVELMEPIAADLVEEAVRSIVRRHRILTARFEEHGPGRWRQHYQESEPKECFARVDLGRLPPSEHNAAIHAYGSAIQNQFAISSGHLYRVVLFDNYRHSRRPALLFLFHHLVFDGASREIVLDELRRHCRGEPIRGGGAAPYDEWCVRLRRYATEGSFAPNAAALQTMVARGEPFLPDSNPRRLAFQREMRHHRTRPLDGGTDVSRLEYAVETLQANVLHLLLAAFGHACHELQPRTSLPLYVMSAQRESFLDDVDLTQSVGFFAGAYPVLLDISPGDIDRTAQNVKEVLLSTPKAGLDYLVTRFMSVAGGPYEGLDHPYPMLFHYADERDRGSHGFCVPLKIPVGSTHSPRNPSAYLINVTATLDAEGLGLTIYYSGAHFDQITISRLARSFERHLRDIARINLHQEVIR
ncbi:non-ribosomal peptide synthetase [Mycobacteroides immunogenum]|uniref:non-ribosomal peptide synthetase n=1 Tax=Mycobacteroides immunogenum TaxID=83262 RepID=UPI000AC48D47|nr:non-ribosomal peptide synthetase [Mycobacteroides immunogenum]